MKSFVFFFATLSLFAYSVIADETRPDVWGPTTNSVQMSIQMIESNDYLQSNQPVILKVKFRNLSSNKPFSTIIPLDREADPNFSFLINTPSGTNIFLSKDSAEPHSGSAGYINVAPGQTRELEFNLSRLYKFDELGTYEIVARRWMDTGVSSNEPPVGSKSQSVKIFSGCLLVSNPLKVTLIQAR
jgi:hypothetical protein